MALTVVRPDRANMRLTEMFTFLRLGHMATTWPAEGQGATSTHLRSRQELDTGSANASLQNGISIDRMMHPTPLSY